VSNLLIPARLAENCRTIPERQSWLERLPATIATLTERWSIRLEPPFDSEAAWVSPAKLQDGSPAILKLGMPHFEGADEVRGLLIWNGNPTVQIIEADDIRFGESPP